MTTPLSDPDNLRLSNVDDVGNAFDDPAYRALLGLPDQEEAATTGPRDEMEGRDG